MVLKNIDYFELLVSNPEKLIDRWYSGKKEEIVIPINKSEKNLLVEANEKLIECINVYNYFRFSKNYEKDHKEVQELFDLMIRLLSVKGINYSAFAQYFMVQNISHSLFTKLSYDDKINILYHTLEEYLKNRHQMYINHGYSNIILQVLSDNYSHKRKGSSGIDKIVNQVFQIGPFTDSVDIHSFIANELSIFLPDKVSKNEYNNLISHLKMEFRYSKQRQAKIPDAILKVYKHIFVIEHKNMKEGGGGQDKQISEILDFIRYCEEGKDFHYITYLDGIFSNKLFPGATAKNKIQYIEAVEVLNENPSNYFVNTFAFEKLITDYVKHGGEHENK